VVAIDLLEKVIKVQYSLLKNVNWSGHHQCKQYRWGYVLQVMKNWEALL